MPHWTFTTPHRGHPGQVVADALEKLDGDFFAHGFDDDPPADVARLVREAVLTDAVWASGKVQEQRMDGTPTGVVYSGLLGERSLFRNSTPLQGCVFRSGVLDMVPFCEPGSARATYDWDFALRVYTTFGAPAHVPEVVGYWRLNPDGIIAQPSTPVETEAWQERRSEIWNRRAQ